MPDKTAVSSLPSVKIETEKNPLFTLYMPASLGEICQGIYQGQEKLASYAINLFNQMIFYPGKLPDTDRDLKPANYQGKSLQESKSSGSPRIYYYRTMPASKKSNHNTFTADAASNLQTVASCMPDKLLQLYNFICQQKDPGQLPREFSIVHISRIPLGRGMGSSTADLALLAAGLKKLSSQQYEPDWLAEILPAIEPTDSTFFPEITIYEQNAGSCWHKLGNLQQKTQLRVLALGQPGNEDTLASRRSRSKPPQLSECFSLLEEAVKQNDIALLSRAATCSSRSWLKRLDYPGLEEIIDEASQNYVCEGVNIAHSGNVIGVIYLPGKANIAGLRSFLDRRGLSVFYPQQQKYKIIAGGIREIQGV